MAEVKTKPTTVSPLVHINAIEDEGRRKDAKALLKIYQEVTGQKAVMWGEAIVGYGSYTIKSGPWPLAAFAVRKNEFVLYVGATRQAERLKALGKHKVGGGCLYVKRLSDVDEAVLRAAIADGYAHTKAENAC